MKPKTKSPLPNQGRFMPFDTRYLNLPRSPQFPQGMITWYCGFCLGDLSATTNK